MSRRILRLVLALALAVPVALHAEDKWHEHYQGALKAIASRKWGDAEKKLKAAMTSGPPAGRQVRMYGVRFIDYLPEYHLGQVYFNQQRYADALEQFAKVQAGGHVLKADAEYPSLSDMIELCRIRTAGARDDGKQEAEALVRFARDLMARGNLEEARRALDSAAAKQPGSASVTAAREDLVRGETERRMRAEQERIAALGAPPVRAADVVATTLPPPRSTTATPGPTRADAAVERVDSSAERAAFEAFYSGDYRIAAERFDTLVARSPRPARNRLVGYAACSRAGAALVRGPDGAADLERARRMYAEGGAVAARALGGDRLVSPRILDALKGQVAP